MSNKKSWYKSLTGSIFFHIILFFMVGLFAVSAASKVEDKEDIIDIVYDADAGGGGGGGNSKIEQEVQELIKQEEVKVQAKAAQDADAIVNNQEAIKPKDEQPNSTSTHKTHDTANANTGTGGGEGTGSGTGTGSGKGSGTGSGEGDGVGGGKGSGTGDGEGDGGNTPTVPPRLVSSIKPVYPEDARNNNWEGSVVVKALINKNGDVDSVTIARSSGHSSLDQSALNAVMKYKFAPAKNSKGRAVACNMNVPVNFGLE